MHERRADCSAHADGCTAARGPVSRYIVAAETSLLVYDTQAAQQAAGVSLAIHPDDPPMPLLGHDGVSFETLGHVDLDDNARSGWRARERRTVYVPKAAEGCFLLIVISNQ